MLIPHPLLGPRAAAEFTNLGDAALLTRPAPGAPGAPDEAALDRFHDWQHLRDNPAGLHRELWFHEHGARSWLLVTRATVTNQILGAELARDAERPGS